MQLSDAEDHTTQPVNGQVLGGSRAVEDPEHVVTSFARNLGDLIRSRSGTSGRLKKGETRR